MRFDLRLGPLQDDDRTEHPVIMVTATIQEGDSVTVGSQFHQEFSVEALGAFLSERRSPRPENEQVSQENPDMNVEPMTEEQANALDRRDQEAEDTTRNEAANLGDDLATGPVEEDSSDGSEEFETLSNEDEEDSDMFECPSCDREFKTERGLESHIASKHDEG